MTAIETTPELVRKSYARTHENLAIVRKRLGRPLSFAEKILFGHLDNAKGQDLVAGRQEGVAHRHRDGHLAAAHFPAGLVVRPEGGAADRLCLLVCRTTPEAPQREPALPRDRAEEQLREPRGGHPDLAA